MQNLKNLPPFYIGQKIVLIESVMRSDGLFINKGMEFIVKGLIKSPCNCGGGISIDIGLLKTSAGSVCTICGHTHIYPGNEWFIRANKFSPIQEQKFPLISLSKVIEKEKELVSAN